MGICLVKAPKCRSFRTPSYNRQRLIMVVLIADNVMLRREVKYKPLGLLMAISAR